jgi:heptosyltransferase III
MVGRINRRRDRWTKRALEFVARPLVRRPRVDFSAVVSARPRRILIVRQHNQMGDMLCATPALRAIRRAFPRARTLLVTAPVNDGVVRNNPDLDAILLFDKRAVRSSPRTAWRFYRELRGFGADLAFVLNTVSFSGTSAWLAVLSGARFIIGGDSTPFGWSFSRWLYSVEMPSEPEVTGHAIDHGLRPLEAIGIEATERFPVLVPGDDADREADAFLDGLNTDGAIAAVHPGAGKAENQWPAEWFARAIVALEGWGAKVFVIEGPADGPAVAATFDALGTTRPVLRGVGLRTVAAALGRAHVALVNDTGVMHVAGAMGVPAVALFGPTPRAQWEPPSPELVALQSPDGTMRGLRPESVLPALQERLQRGRLIRPRARVR